MLKLSCIYLLRLGVDLTSLSDTAACKTVAEMNLRTGASCFLQITILTSYH